MLDFMLTSGGTFANIMMVKQLVRCALALLIVGACRQNDDRAELRQSVRQATTDHLGLDLRGGSYLLLEVDIPGVIKQTLESRSADVREEFRRERIAYDSLSTATDSVTVHVLDSAEFDTARKILGDLVAPPAHIVDSAGNDMAVPLTSDLPQLDFSDDGRGNYALKMSEAYRRWTEALVVAQTISALRRRIEILGKRDLTVQQQSDNRIEVRVLGAKNAQAIMDILDSARMSFRLTDPSANLQDALAGRIPPDDELLWATDNTGKTTAPYVVQRRVLISGARVASAATGFNARNEREPSVYVRLDERGARALADITRENVNRVLAIVLDNKVISAPVIR